MIKPIPLPRYEPDMDGEMYLPKSGKGDYINRTELIERLNQMIEDAQDPHDTSALTGVLMLLED